MGEGKGEQEDGLGALELPPLVALSGSHQRAKRSAEIRAERINRRQTLTRNRHWPGSDCYA